MTTYRKFPKTVMMTVAFNQVIFFFIANSENLQNTTISFLCRTLFLCRAGLVSVEPSSVRQLCSVSYFFSPNHHKRCELPQEGTRCALLHVSAA